MLQLLRKGWGRYVQGLGPPGGYDHALRMLAHDQVVVSKAGPFVPPAVGRPPLCLLLAAAVAWCLGASAFAAGVAWTPAFAVPYLNWDL
jgi:hypothetical protein